MMHQCFYDFSSLVVSDPYVVVFCEKKKAKTRVIKNNINPEFNERMTFYHRKPDEDITIEVCKITL